MQKTHSLITVSWIEGNDLDDNEIQYYCDDIVLKKYLKKYMEEGQEVILQALTQLIWQTIETNNNIDMEIYKLNNKI